MRVDIYGHGQTLYENFVLFMVTRDLESNEVAKCANVYTNNKRKHMGDWIIVDEHKDWVLGW